MEIHELFEQLPPGARVVIKHKALGSEVEVSGTFVGTLNVPRGEFPSIIPHEFKEPRILIRDPLTKGLIGAVPLRDITNFHAPDHNLMLTSREGFEAAVRNATLEFLKKILVIQNQGTETGDAAQAKAEQKKGEDTEKPT